MDPSFKPLVRTRTLSNPDSRRWVFRHPLLIATVALVVTLMIVWNDVPVTEAVAPNFAAKQEFTTGSGPFYLAVGDFNNDGKPDVAVSNSSSATVSVLLNTTTAGATSFNFAANQEFSTGANPWGVAAADFNGDGKLDLAVASSSNNVVAVLLNTTAPGAATPNFAAKQDFATGMTPRGIKAADLNLDGLPDLAVLNSASGVNTVSVLLNTTTTGAPTPGFAAKQDFATGNLPHNVALGDLNGDGKLDLAVENANDQTVSVFINTMAPGAPTPAFAARQDFATGASPSSITMCDVNGDGKLDIATGNGSSSVSVLLNTTVPGSNTANFVAKQDFVSTPVQSIVGADLNGDGRLDLAGTGPLANVASVLQNNTAPGSATASFAAKQDFSASTGAIAIAAGDLNGDGQIDLVVANAGANTVSVFRNTTTIGTATASFTAKQDFTAANFPVSVAVGDLNGDGLRDVAAVASSNSVSVLLNTTAPGAATAGFADKQDFPTDSTPQSLTMADFNLDGRLDLIVANNTASVFLNNTATGSTTASFARQDFAVTDAPKDVAAGDLNGDGKPDLVTAGLSSNVVSVRLNTTAPGAAMASFATKQDFGTGVFPEAVTLGDLNRDGRLDIAVATSNSGSVSVLLNTTAPGAATPSFASKQDFAAGNGLSRPKSVSVGDLNGDGNPDLAVGNQMGQTVSVLLNTTAAGATTPSFAGKQEFNTGTGPRTVQIGDLNGDGKLDLAVVNQFSSTVSVFVNTTATGAAIPSFAIKQDFGTNASPFSLALGDVNLDGRLDLVLGNDITNKVSVLLNSPTIVSTAGLSRQQGSASSNSQIASVTDYGGNGAPTVTVTSANPSNGVTISNIVNTNGNVTADIAASCAAANATFTLQASDGSSAVTTTLNVNVTANTAPTLTYPTPQSVAFNGSVNVSPTTASDNGSITGYAVQSVVPALTTAPTVNASGVVSITNAQPGGSHMITIRATDNCGVTSDAAFTLNVSRSNQTITVGTHAPATAAHNTSFTVAATSSSGLPVSYNSAGVCTNVGATFTMTSGTGTCTVKYDQGGDTNFNPATQVTESVTAQKANQTITVGTHAPANATFNTSFTVAATSNSGLTVAYSSAGVCTNAGATFTITSGTGTCTVRYDQTGDSNFNAATQVTESVTAQKVSTATAISSSLNPSALGESVTFTAMVTSTAGTPTGTVQFKIDGVNSGGPVTLNGSGIAQLTTSSLAAGTHTVTADYSGDTNFAVSTGTLSGGQQINNRPLIGLSAASYNVGESSGFVMISVTRGGDTGPVVSVDYSTSADNGLPCSNANGVATPKCDFTSAVGTLNFAAGETNKTITVLISQDSFVEGAETFSLSLSNATAAAGLVSPATASITITDDATEPPANPIDEAGNFVRQHYHDFLNREPDPIGWDFWTKQITSCASNVQCNEVKRIDVSASFFLSIEFQQAGYLVERAYKVSYGDGTGTSSFGGQHQLPVPIVRVNEFLIDTQRIGRGVVVLAPGWEQALESNKQAYALEFVQTSRFVTAFPTTMTPAEFVDKLNQNAGNVLSPSERTTAINLFGAAGNSSNLTARAQALRQVAEDPDLYNAEFNRAFVLAEYFGYLRRNPNDAPESTLDYTGFDFWLTKLNQFNGNYINAEMVKAFLSSIEYRNRFGP